jgi:hypothetical protein
MVTLPVVTVDAPHPLHATRSLCCSSSVELGLEAEVSKCSGCKKTGLPSEIGKMRGFRTSGCEGDGLGHAVVDIPHPWQLHRGRLRPWICHYSGPFDLLASARRGWVGFGTSMWGDTGRPACGPPQSLVGLQPSDQFGPGPLPGTPKMPERKPNSQLIPYLRPESLHARRNSYLSVLHPLHFCSET